MNTSQAQLHNLPESDLALLSAYLDNQLAVAERVGLERRLSAEPRLRAELAELRATAALLRDLEPVRPPRSFTLDPATTPRRARVFPLAWFMQLGSGFAGLALVLLASVQILIGQPASQVFSTINSGLSADAPPIAASAPESSAASMAAPAPAATSAPAAAATAAPAVEAAPGAGAEPKQPAADQAADASSARLSATAAPAGGSAAGESAPPIANSESSSPSTYQIPATAADPQQPGASVPPGLTLVVGVALLALAAGSYLYRRQA